MGNPPNKETTVSLHESPSEIHAARLDFEAIGPISSAAAQDSTVTSLPPVASSGQHTASSTIAKETGSRAVGPRGVQSIMWENAHTPGAKK